MTFRRNLATEQPIIWSQSVQVCLAREREIDDIGPGTRCCTLETP